jgi:hypothetical protein
MKRIWLTLLAVFIVSISVSLMYHDAFGEIRTIKIKIPSCM